MALIKDIQEKNFASLKDYVGERIASIVTGKILKKKDEFLNKVRGITEKMKPEEKKEDEKEGKDPDKDGDNDNVKSKDTDKDGGQDKEKSKDK